MSLASRNELRTLFRAEGVSRWCYAKETTAD